MATQHIVVGINEVTKRLEQQIRDTRNILNLTNIDPNPRTHDALPILKVVFACRADVNPTVLVDHLPHLVAAFNSIRSSPTCLLVPLPRGAEVTLSDALGIRRAAVVGLSVSPFFHYWRHVLTLHRQTIQTLATPSISSKPFQNSQPAGFPSTSTRN